ncbi:MAG: nucleoid-associated protein [Pseudomonadales bacterium]|nr:nucleoid-associated protein [Pseudomonadales bacterium]
MSIINSIVHFVDKNLVTEEVSVKYRETALPNTPELEHLSGQMKKGHRTKAEKYFGFFAPKNASIEAKVPDFSVGLREYLDETLTWTEFSKQLADTYASEITASMLATGGYLYLEHYTESAKGFLLVAILSQVKGVVVTDEMSLESCRYLDISNVQSVALINILEWQEARVADDNKQYITAARGKGNGRVVEYFRKLIGFEESFNTTDETSTLVEAVDYFCENQSLDAEQIKEYKKKAYSYCDDKAKSGEPVILKELSYSLDADDPDSFLQFAMDQRFGLSEEIPTDRRELKKFVRYSGQGGGMSIAFSSDLLGKDVVYERDSDRLIIKKIPENLKEQLLTGC